MFEPYCWRGVGQEGPQILEILVEERTQRQIKSAWQMTGGGWADSQVLGFLKSPFEHKCLAQYRVLPSTV